ncbi:Protein NHX-3 b, partial [Aphelenchoides avenae]
GITFRPLLMWLNIECAEERRLNVIESVYSRCFDYTMAGVEQISGQLGRNGLRERFERLNAKVLKPILMRGEKRMPFDASQIMRAYAKICLHEAIDIARMKYTTITQQNSAHKVEDEEQAKIEQLVTEQVIARNTDALYKTMCRLLDRRLAELRLVTDRNQNIGDLTARMEDNIREMSDSMTADEAQAMQDMADAIINSATVNSSDTTISANSAFQDDVEQSRGGRKDDGKY